MVLISVLDKLEHIERQLKHMQPDDEGILTDSDSLTCFLPNRSKLSSVDDVLQFEGMLQQPGCKRKIVRCTIVVFKYSI